MVTALRVWAFLVAIAFIGSVGYFFIPALRGDPEPTTKTLAIVASPVAPAALFVWGLAVWDTRGAWLARLVAWPALVAGCFVLIGCTFVLLFLLLTTAQTLWPWQVWDGERNYDTT